MKCLKCGADLPDNAKFCSYCGTQVGNPEPQPDGSLNEEKKYHSHKDSVIAGKSKSYHSHSSNRRLTEKWESLSKGTKIMAIAAGTFILLFLEAFLFGRTAAAAIAFLQFILTVIALFIRGHVVKTTKNFLHIIIFIAALVLSVLYAYLFRLDYSNAGLFKWSDMPMADILPSPKTFLGSAFGEIKNSSADDLTVSVYFTDYDNYVAACETNGFTIEKERSAQSFSAYNDNGNKLSLNYDETIGTLQIHVTAAKQYETLNWPKNPFANMLPVPKSAKGEITQNDEHGFCVSISDSPIDEFNAYTAACEEKGFCIDIQSSDKSFLAKNDAGYRLSVTYEGNNVISISVAEPLYNVTIGIECVANWLFSKYDVKVYLNGISQGTLNHGNTGTITSALAKGVYEIKFVSAEDSTVTGSVSIDVRKEETFRFKIFCTSTGIDIQNISTAETGNNNNNKSEPTDGGEQSSESAIAEESGNSAEPSDEDSDEEALLAEALEQSFPVENARRAVIVAMTNGSASDVFAEDGNTYDLSKFHTYSDINDFFMTLDTDGAWSAIDESTWHVDGIVLRLYDYDTYSKVSCSVKKEGDLYTVFHVNCRRAGSRYNLDRDDPSKISVSTYEPSENNPFLIIPETLISADRDTVSENKKLKEKEDRKAWIGNQFSSWDGRHKKLTDLIKDALNDSKSFKHINTDYIEVLDEATQSLINDTLQKAGSRSLVEIGDLFIIEEFSAKNAYNATVKGTAYGIARSNTNKVILLRIE